MEDGSLPSRYNANYISKEGEELFWNLGLLRREDSDGRNLNLYVAQVKYKNRTSIYFRNRPALPCYVSIYDGDIVIKFLKSLPGWNQDEISLKELTLKKATWLAMPLAIAIALLPCHSLNIFSVEGICPVRTTIAKYTKSAG